MHRTDVAAQMTHQTDRLALTLDWPPTGNHCYTVARGRKILASKGRFYRDVSVESLLRQSQGATVTGKLRVQINASPPDRRARDLDNLIKLPMDCLQRAGIIENDKDVDMLVVVRGDVVKGGSFEIVVETLQRSVS